MEYRRLENTGISSINVKLSDDVVVHIEKVHRQHPTRRHKKNS